MLVMNSRLGASFEGFGAHPSPPRQSHRVCCCWCQRWPASHCRAAASFAINAKVRQRTSRSSLSGKRRKCTPNVSPPWSKKGFYTVPLVPLHSISRQVPVSRLVASRHWRIEKCKTRWFEEPIDHRRSHEKRAGILDSGPCGSQNGCGGLQPSELFIAALSVRANPARGVARTDRNSGQMRPRLPHSDSVHRRTENDPHSVSL